MIIGVLFLVISTAVLAKGIPCESKDMPKNDFIVSKSQLSSDDDLKQKVSKELGKVSGNKCFDNCFQVYSNVYIDLDNVKAFSEKILRVARTLLRDWILRNVIILCLSDVLPKLLYLKNRTTEAMLAKQIQSECLCDRYTFSKTNRLRIKVLLSF